MTNEEKNNSISSLENTKIGLTCGKCSGKQFHTRYTRGVAVAWICDMCKTEILRTKKRKTRKRGKK